MKKAQWKKRTTLFSLISLGFVMGTLTSWGQILQYDFNTASATQTNTGSLGGTMVTKDSSGVATNYVGGTGVSGLPGDQSLNFTSTQANGTGPRGDGSTLDALNSMTITGWSSNGVIQQAYTARIFSNLSGSTGFSLNITGTALELNIGGTSIFGNGVYDFTSSDWKFWAVTFDGGTGEVSFYFGGTTGALTLFKTTTSKTSIAASSTAYTLGNIGTGIRGFDAQIDNFALYDTALTATDLLNLRNVAIVPEPGTLVLFGLASFAILLFRRKGGGGLRGFGK